MDEELAALEDHEFLRAEAFDRRVLANEAYLDARAPEWRRCSVEVIDPAELVAGDMVVVRWPRGDIAYARFVGEAGGARLSLRDVVYADTEKPKGTYGDTPSLARRDFLSFYRAPRADEAV